MKPYKSTDTKITDISALEPDAIYTYQDYLRWSFEERVELIKGKLFKMSPAPSRKHQEVSRELSLALGNFLKGKTCKVYAAPFDVRFPNTNDQKTYTVVQPDLCVICDHTKLDDAGCNGAPDLIIEILSPSTAAKDLKDKFELYEENGVKEYWVIYPEVAVVETYLLNADGKYSPPVKYVNGQSVNSEVLAGFEVLVSELFVD
ncbi:Uma2 family endonuclease [Marinoscillum furvescens]|uniref:Uma2 family endonuclease n=1 Tax=Marinoscillum furvescens DSM 4134 TaxID=1122208 RepID=A0A3D9LGV2_MARFU|nr:Uma2 family endonuclease [Marinoscillum furvescens]REE05611.1 Uma2 family endonuclease [Marinoscillum furvescens DSM 4134]